MRSSNIIKRSRVTRYERAAPLVIEDNTPRLFLYARKSTESEDRQVQSIDDQVRLATQSARDRRARIVDQEGESRSAKRADERPGFLRMVAALETGAVNGIIAWHPDRLARNAVDGGRILDLLDRGKIKYLYFVSGYSFENTPEGKYMLNLIFSQAKYQIDKLSTDVNRGLNTKREQGHFPHRAPEGYKNDVVEKTIVTDPERFPLLRRAIELILQERLRPIQALTMLNEQWGYRTRMTKRSGGRTLSRTSFYDMLSNPFYFGLCQEKDIEYQGAHQPLMTREEFDRIQQILGKGEKVRPQKHTFTLSGLIRCGRCGCMIVATRSKGHVYYHCTNGRRVCDRKGVREEVLLDQATALLDQITISEEVETSLREMIHRHFLEVYGTQQVAAATQRATMGQIEQQVRELTGMRTRGLLTDDEYMLAKAELADELAHLHRAEAIASAEMDRATDVAQSVLDYALRARRDFDEGSDDDRRRILTMLGGTWCLTGKNLLLELHPYLRPFAKERPSQATLKPLEIGSGKTKKTVSDETVLHGWAFRTMFELCSVINQMDAAPFCSILPTGRAGSGRRRPTVRLRAYP